MSLRITSTNQKNKRSTARRPLVLMAGCLFVPCCALAEARRENWKCLMRGHLQSLTEAMRHLSNGEFEAAAAAAESNFGLAPGAVEYCREPPFTKENSLRAAMLPPSPPPEVRAIRAGRLQRRRALSLKPD
jgi:hypothetical protein